MATVGIVSVGIASHLNACFEIARRLRQRGHSVVLASPDARVGPRLAAYGIAFFHLDAQVPQPLHEKAKRARRWSILRRAGAGYRRLRTAIAEARGRAALAGMSIEALIAQHAPALLLVESELQETVLYLLRKRLPLAVLDYHVSVRRRRGVAPLSSKMMPVAPLPVLRAALSWWWLLLKRRLRHSFNRWYHAGWDHRSIWQQIARDSGTRLETVAAEDQWPMLHYLELPMLNLTAPEFDFPNAVSGAQYVGPMVQSERATDDEDAAACRELLATLAGRERPIVACATGSILNLPGFIRKVVRAASGGGFELIVATGRGSDPAHLGELPDNVHAFRFIPQLEVLRQASLFICHAGIGSINESIMAGVPMLVYSGGRLDENGNAARVAYHGLGLRGSARWDNPGSIRKKIDMLLGGARFRRKVDAMREVFLRYVSEDRFDRRIDELLTAAAMRT